MEVTTVLILQLPSTSILYGSIKEVTWNTYNDTNGEFTIDYPLEWVIGTEPPEPPVDVEFWYFGEDSDTYGYVLLGTSPNSTYPNSSAMINFQSDAFLDAEPPNTPRTKVQDTECSNYFISGTQACSQIFSVMYPGQKPVTSVVVDAVHDEGIETSIVLFASNDVYEFFKPVFDHMVDSFKLKSTIID